MANPSSLLVSGSGSGSLKNLDAQTTFRQRFAADFRNLTEVLKKRRIVIIIDDLDRCRPEKIREVMEAVNFLVSSGKCFGARISASEYRVLSRQKLRASRSENAGRSVE